MWQLDKTLPTFTLLDYGLTALAMVMMAAMLGAFIWFIKTQMTKMVEVIDELVQVTRSMRDNFFRVTEELRNLQSQIEADRAEWQPAVDEARDARRDRKKEERKQRRSTREQTVEEDANGTA